jgi:hypothetical protein
VVSGFVSCVVKEVVRGDLLIRSGVLIVVLCGRLADLRKMVVGGKEKFPFLL